MATMTKPTFQPFVPAAESRPEFTFRALLLGALFGILFGAVTVYVGLRAGLTVAASIPISVLSISILRALGTLGDYAATRIRIPLLSALIRLIFGRASIL